MDTGVIPSRSFTGSSYSWTRCGHQWVWYRRSRPFVASTLGTPWPTGCPHPPPPCVSHPPPTSSSRPTYFLPSYGCPVLSLIHLCQTVALAAHLFVHPPDSHPPLLYSLIMSPSTPVFTTPHTYPPLFQHPNLHRVEVYCRRPFPGHLLYSSLACQETSFGSPICQLGAPLELLDVV